MHNSHVPRRTNEKLVRAPRLGALNKYFFKKRGFRNKPSPQALCNHPSSKTNKARFLLPRECSVFKME